MEVNKNVFEKVTDKPVASPGMKYKHYAPKTKCVLVYSNEHCTKLDSTVDAIRSISCTT